MAEQRGAAKNGRSGVRMVVEGEGSRRSLRLSSTTHAKFLDEGKGVGGDQLETVVTSEDVHKPTIRESVELIRELPGKGSRRPSG